MGGIQKQSEMIHPHPNSPKLLHHDATPSVATLSARLRNRPGMMSTHGRAIALYSDGRAVIHPHQATLRWFSSKSNQVLRRATHVARLVGVSVVVHGWLMHGGTSFSSEKAAALIPQMCVCHTQDD